MAKTQHGRDLSGAEMAQMLDEFCNGMDDRHVQDFVQTIVCRTHRTLQQRIMSLFIATIDGWAEAFAKSNYDLRNESTVKLARRIIDATGDKYDRYLPLI